MVPVNLRNLFPNKSLRNFSLYALPRIQPEDMARSFEQLSERMSGQRREQLSCDALQSMIAANYRLQQAFWWLPLKIKCAALRFSYRFISGKNSSLTFSNMGNFTLPERMRPYIRRVDFFLTPRLYFACNCGLIAYDGRLYINFTKYNALPELERCFLKRLGEL